MPITFTDVTSAIITGELDASLDLISQAIKERKEAQSRVLFFALKPGDRIRFTKSVRPKYLAGKVGTLVALRDKKVTVNLDGPSGRFNRGIVTPVSLIEKIS